MKILSRPKVEQPCAEVVESCLESLYPSHQGNLGGNLKFNAYGITESDQRMNLIMRTLKLSKVIKDYRIGSPAERTNSTFEHQKWSQRVSFTGDGQSWYLAELTYEFRVQV